MCFLRDNLVITVCANYWQLNFVHIEHHEHIDFRLAYTKIENQVMADPNNIVVTEPSNHGSIITMGEISEPNVDWVNGFRYDCTRFKSER